jgi:acetyltransferase
MATPKFDHSPWQRAIDGHNLSMTGWPGGEVSIRKMTCEDGDLLKSFFQSLSPLARQQRFMSPMGDVPDNILEQLSRVDQPSHVAYLAETRTNGHDVMIAEVRYVVEPGNDQDCEFAIAVADAWQGHGIGRELLAILEKHAAQEGRRELTADTLPENHAMISLAKRCGFAVGRNQYDFRVKKLTKQVTMH